jgi:hypothetical protein
LGFTDVSFFFSFLIFFPLNFHLPAQIPVPSYVSAPAKNLLMQFLTHVPHQRIGSRPGGVTEIKAHKWFAGFDWEALAARKMPAPRLPKDSDLKRVQDMMRDVGPIAQGKRDAAPPPLTKKDVFEHF